MTRKKPVTKHQLEVHDARCAALAARLQRNMWKQRAERAEAAIKWAMGEDGDFPERAKGQGAYWWRTELASRAEYWRVINPKPWSR